MGRRSINTTKSGKFMNPTDQARKEARKKELKKNKKQRQMVRAAVLKMKDPTQILEELEKIDEMEFNVFQPSPLNEKVLKEKRKKLKETFDRVLKMYDKDEPEKWFELKRQENEYEKKRTLLIAYYESVKHAQSVQVDDIPLPTSQVPENMMYLNMTSQIPLPVDPAAPVVPSKPILKKDSVYKERPAGVEPPGVPPGPPPDFMELILEATKVHVKLAQKKTLRFSDANEDMVPPGEEAPVQRMEGVEESYNAEILDITRAVSPPLANAASAPKPTSLQQRMLALSGQNIDDFMKEMEEVHKKRERDRAADLNARLTALKRKDRRDSESDSEEEMPSAMPPMSHIPPESLEPPGTEMRHIPPPLIPSGMRPPLRPPMGPPSMRMPPGPPPGRPGAPPGPPPGLPPRAMLRPPGPPPGMPPNMMRSMLPPPPPKLAPAISVLTAAPQLLPKKDSAQGATISAKPQIRNLSADVTRFVPSALRVKREDKKSKTVFKVMPQQRPLDIPKQVPTKDDAYMQFMREMEGLL